MPLHRFITPTYTGGLPGTHDLINVISGGTGLSDGSAPADGAKAAPHVNAGTYFVAFGEDATSADANRGFRALAENTDFLDDVVHRDLAVPVLTAVVVPGADVSTLVLPGTVFVGTGVADGIDTRSSLVVLLDGDNNPLHALISGSWQAPKVTKIHEGSGVSVVGNGTEVNPTIDISPAIPTGQAYKVAYFTRSTLVAHPEDLSTRLSKGWSGTDDLWAFTRNILQTNQTFLGDNTHSGANTFSSTVTLDAGVLFSATSAVEFFNTVAVRPASVWTVDLNTVTDAPRLVLPSLDGLTVTQVTERVHDAGPPIRYHRTYTRNGEFWETYNARWDEGTSLWVPDDTASPAHRRVLDSDVEELYVRDSPLPASWALNDWESRPVEDRSFVSGSANFRISQAAVPNAFIALVDSADFADPDYDWFALFTTTGVDGISSLYTATERAGVKQGLSYLQNAIWDPSGHEWLGTVNTHHNYMTTLGGDDILGFRKGSFVAGTIDDDEWDFEGSLRGMQFGNWSVTETPFTALCLAVRPRTSTRAELWVFGQNFAPDGKVTRARTPMGDYEDGGGSITSDGNNPSQLMWHEGTSQFYSLLSSGKIDSSPDGAGPWTEVGDIGMGTIARFSLDDVGGFVGFSEVDTDVRRATSPAGPFTVQATGAANGVTDCIYCSRSGLWVLADLGNTSPGQIFTSPDRISWTLEVISGTALPATGLTRFQLAYNPSQNVVVGVGKSEGELLVVRSADGGATWARVEPLSDVLDIGQLTNEDVRGVMFAGGRFLALVDRTSGAYQIIHGSADGLRWKVAYDFGQGPGATHPDPTTKNHFAAGDSAAVFVGGGVSAIAHSLILA